MKAQGLVVSFGLALVSACGGQHGAGDAGASDATSDGAGSGWRALDLTATVTVTPVRGTMGAPDALFTTFPTTFELTLAWDPTKRLGWAGAYGAFGGAGVDTADEGTLVVSGLVARAPFDLACDGRADIVLDAVTLTLDGNTVRGTTTGTAVYVTNAGRFQAPLTAALVGSPDATAPTLTVPDAGLDPLAGWVFEASEPLPPDATASLVGATSGDVVPLGAVHVDLQDTAVQGFAEAGTVLRPGETYAVGVDQVTDFAGHRGKAPPTFTTRAAPPLVPEDGFESIPDGMTMFGGAGVLRGGPLMPITGATSLLLNTGYGGGFGFLPYSLGPSISVRLAVAPGDTVVRLDSQLIAPDPIDAASFVGEIRFGTVGGTVAVSRDVPGVSFVKTTLPQLGDIYLSPVAPLEFPLPADAKGEILFEIVGTIDLCQQPPSPTVLVIDNLRVE